MEKKKQCSMAYKFLFTKKLQSQLQNILHFYPIGRLIIDLNTLYVTNGHWDVSTMCIPASSHFPKLLNYSILFSSL